MVIIMRTWLLLQLSILLLLSIKTDGIFFQYPKKIVAEFLQSIHGKKEVTNTLTNVHHYHVHYYPVPWVTIKRTPLPEPHAIDVRPSDHLRSIGWKDQYLDPSGVYFPVPSIKQEPVRLPWTWRNEYFEKSHGYHASYPPPGILYPFPLHQQIVLYHPDHPMKKPSLLMAFFDKLHHIKNFLFHHKSDDDCIEEDHKPSINNFISY